MTATAKITDVERILLVVPMIDRVRREMERANIHRWSESEIIRLTLDDGTVAYGETIQNYTWGRVPDTDRVIGRSPFDCMWDDSLGAGLQMALFDAAGKIAGVPVYRLLGRKVRDWCPVSFWDHDMGPAAYEQEARTAVELGFTSIKIKTRPWQDVYETVKRISDATPAWFHIDCDWNDFLLDVSTAAACPAPSPSSKATATVSSSQGASQMYCRLASPPPPPTCPSSCRWSAPASPPPWPCIWVPYSAMPSGPPSTAMNSTSTTCSTSASPWSAATPRPPNRRGWASLSTKMPSTPIASTSPISACPAA